MKIIDHRHVVNSINYTVALEIITDFIRTNVASASADGVVVGLSGGVDSTVAASIATKALGKEHVLGLIMPSSYTPREDIDDALNVAKALGIKYIYINIDPIVNAYVSTIPSFDHRNRIAAGNLLPRIRMTLLYYYANLYNYLVLGTGDRSEILLGYYTKYGDGGVDLLPLGNMYKTQVRRVAELLGFERIARKPSSPRLWAGHRAEEELGGTYEEIDPILFAIFDLGMSLDEVYKMFRRDLVDIIMRWHKRTEHKRRMPPVPDLAKARILGK